MPISNQATSMTDKPHGRCRHRRKPGFGLIELLMTLLAIGMVASLVIPTIQAGREEARRAQCTEHLRRVGRALGSHLEAHGHLPSGGGRGGRQKTKGGPPAGYASQRWGWAYQLLPFLDRQELWDKHEYAVESTPIPEYFCPARRAPTLFRQRALNDYAGVGGGGDRKVTVINVKYSTSTPLRHNGVIVPWLKEFKGHPGGFITPAGVVDGLSQTMAVGEKALGSRGYRGGSPSDTRGYWIGWALESVRFVRSKPVAPSLGAPIGKNAHLRPRRDSPLPLTHRPDYLGAAHPSGFGALFCDGSVRAIAYAVDTDALVAMARRDDRGETPEAAGGETP